METEILQRLRESKIDFKIISTHQKNTRLGENSLYVELISLEAHKNICWVGSDFLHLLKDLANQVIIFYPDSDFAKWWRKQQLLRNEDLEISTHEEQKSRPRRWKCPKCNKEFTLLYGRTATHVCIEQNKD